MNGLAGRTALVTGAAGGIGLASSRRLLSEGARVVMVDINGPGLLQVQEELWGADLLTIRADITAEGEIERAMTAAEAHFGGVDLLYNNAGTLGEAGPFWEVSTESFDRVMALNCRATYLFLQSFVRRLVARGARGAAVNASSTAGTRGLPGLSAYCASKQAILGITRAAAVETGPKGVRINAICPGRVDTEMVAAFVSSADRRPSGDALPVAGRPIDRPATPAEIANLVAWLLSDEAAFVTGAVYAIDGGQTAA